MPQTELLAADNLSKSFGGVRALRSVSFVLDTGQVHALVGENGAGKSTFAKILTGLVQPDTGAIYLRGEEAHFRSAVDAQRNGIALIPQELMLVPDLTVAENIALPRPALRRGWSSKIGRLDRQAAIARAEQALAAMDVRLDPRTKAKDLGASQAQMVLIARALSLDMQVLIMDEPTAALTPRETRDLEKRMQLLREHGVGIIYISHKIEETLKMSDRVTILRDGQCVASLAADEAGVDEVVRLMLGRDLESMYPKRLVSVGDPVLALDRLTRRRTVRDVSLTVRAGEIVGVTGLVGAGKTELARVITGVDELESGSIAVGSEHLTSPSIARVIDAGVGYVPEDRKADGLVLSLSAHQNICMALLNLHKRKVRGIRRGRLRQSKLRSVTTGLIHRFGVRLRSIDQLAGELSGGNQQKIVIAKAFSTDPRVLVLDEPTRGIDVGSKVEIYRAIQELAAHGVGVLMLSSEIQEVLEMCDRVLVMRAGRIVAEFSRGEATEAAVMRAAVSEVPAP